MMDYLSVKSVGSVRQTLQKWSKVQEIPCSHSAEYKTVTKYQNEHQMHSPSDWSGGGADTCFDL